MPAADRNKALGLVLAVGLIGGQAVQRATLALSNTEIGGPGWTLRGNGALVVVFGGVAMLLAAGWVVLAQRAWRSTVAAGVLTLVLELGFVLLPVLVGPDAPWLATIAPLYLIVPIVLPLLVALPFVARRWSGWLALLSLLWLVAVLAGLWLGTRLS
jgi:hypothetical protein